MLGRYFYFNTTKMLLKLHVVFYLLFLMNFAKCNPCARKESVDITSGETFENGSIFHNGFEYISSAWYKIEENNATVRLGCPCSTRVCLWKCCDDGMMYFNKTCTSTDAGVVNPFNPVVYKGQDPVSVQASQHFFYMFNNRMCEDRFSVDSASDLEEMFIQEDATLYQITKGQHQQYHPAGSFCVDMMQTDGQPRLFALVCFPEDSDLPPEDDSPALYIGYAIGLLLSVPFLVATFLVYAFIPELRNLHGMCLMAYCAGLILAYPLLAYLKMSAGDVSVERSSCLTIALLIYYSFQTSFFWLNVMCFDIWRTFSGYRGGGSSSKRRELKRFVLYGLYAWGIPLVLVIITVSMQFAEHLPLNVIRPGLGERRCWFEDWLNELVYFFTPVLMLVVCNGVLFTVTAYRIRAVRQETAILKGAESDRSDKLKRDKQRYCLYLKLFVVMGVNWTVEVISFALGGSNWYWVLIDLSNIGLGVFIFFIFVWKEKVRNLVRKRFLKWRGVSDSRPYSDSSGARWVTTRSSAPTETTRVTTDDHQLKDMH